MAAVIHKLDAEIDETLSKHALLIKQEAGYFVKTWPRFFGPVVPYGVRMNEMIGHAQRELFEIVHGLQSKGKCDELNSTGYLARSLRRALREWANSELHPYLSDRSVRRKHAKGEAGPKEKSIHPRSGPYFNDRRHNRRPMMRRNWLPVYLRQTYRDCGPLPKGVCEHVSD
jgi:hypothetical protein